VRVPEVCRRLVGALPVPPRWGFHLAWSWWSQALASQVPPLLWVAQGQAWVEVCFTFKASCAHDRFFGLE
jgi:hypothetical protein